MKNRREIFTLYTTTDYSISIVIKKKKVKFIKKRKNLVGVVSCSAKEKKNLEDYEKSQNLGEIVG
jgi:hypothetical protein